MKEETEWKLYEIRWKFRDFYFDKSFTSAYIGKIFWKRTQNVLVRWKMAAGN